MTEEEVASFSCWWEELLFLLGSRRGKKGRSNFARGNPVIKEKTSFRLSGPEESRPRHWTSKGGKKEGRCCSLSFLGKGDSLLTLDGKKGKRKKKKETLSTSVEEKALLL